MSAINVSLLVLSVGFETIRAVLIGYARVSTGEQERCLAARLVVGTPDPADRIEHYDSSGGNGETCSSLRMSSGLQNEPFDG